MPPEPLTINPIKKNLPISIVKSARSREDLVVLQQNARAASPLYLMWRASREAALLDGRMAFCKPVEMGKFELTIVAPMRDTNAGLIRLNDTVSLGGLDIDEARQFLQDCDAFFRTAWNGCRLRNGYTQIARIPPPRSYQTLPAPPPEFRNSEIFYRALASRLGNPHAHLTLD
jgi:hypothetical protein